jgi:hypothetical protein
MKINRQKASRRVVILAGVLALALQISPAYAQKITIQHPACVDVCGCNTDCSRTCVIGEDPNSPITCGEWGGWCEGGLSCPGNPPPNPDPCAAGNGCGAGCGPCEDPDCAPPTVACQDYAGLSCSPETAEVACLENSACAACACNFGVWVCP